MLIFRWYKEIFLGVILTTQVITSSDQDHNKFVYHLDMSGSYKYHDNPFKNVAPYLPNNGSSSGWYASTNSSAVHKTGFNSSSDNSAHQANGDFNHPATGQCRLSSQELERQVVQAILIAQLGPEKFQDLVTALHVRKYGVTRDFLWGNAYHKGLYSTRDFDKVANWIIGATGLTKDQALAVWQGYCDKRIVGRNKKIKGYERIAAEYDKRLKAENDAKKTASGKVSHEGITKYEQLKPPTNLSVVQKTNEVAQVRFITQREMLQQFMKQQGLDPEQCIYLPQDFDELRTEYANCGQLCDTMLQTNPSDIWACRAQAAQQTIEQNLRQSSHQIILSPQAQGYLTAQGLPFNIYDSCYGTSLQQQLHEELCFLFESIAQAASLKTSCFLRRATESADASFWANQFEAPSLAMGLIDLGSACCAMGSWVIENGPIYLQAMHDGVVESAWDFAHMVSHPHDTFQNIMNAAWFVFDTIALADEESLGATLEFARRQRQERFDMIHLAAVTMENGIANSTGPERVKFATKFVTDCIFQHKTLQTLGAVAGVFRANAGTLCTMEYVADIMSHEPEFALAHETISQATQELECAVQRSLQSELTQMAEVMPAQAIGETANVAQPVVRSFQEVAQEVAGLNNTIPLSNTTLCDEVKTLVTQLVEEVNVTLDAQFRQQFGSRWRIDNGIKKRVNMDIDHALNYEVKFNKNKITGNLEFKLSGGHLAGSTEALAQKGLIKIIEKRQLPTGCWEYKCIDVLTGKEFFKTEFHCSWTKETIVSYGWNLFENLDIAEYVTNDDKLAKSIHIGKQIVSVVIKKHEKDINLITLVPYEIPKKII